MAEDESVLIRKVDPSESFSNQSEEKRKKRQEPQKKEKQEVKDFFEEIVESVERVHSILQQKNSPYRFCVYKDGGEIFIDIVIHDENKNIKNIIKKNITHDEFQEMIKSIENLDGFLLDYTV